MDKGGYCIFPLYPFFFLFIVMKKILPLGLSMLCFVCSCGTNKMLTVTVKNPLNMERSGEFIEIPLEEVVKSGNPSTSNNFKIVDAQQREVAYQITHDGKVIFPVSVLSGAESKYYISQGTPSKVDIISYGKIYPERMDDLAWENDKTGYRAYGPTLQKRGEKGFGYDLFAKRGTSKPVLEGMYKLEANSANWNKFRELKKTDPVAAEKWRRYITYHVDKGYGMDCYAVGPTLGAGAAALVDNGEIVYPWCYKTCEILDNGPLRFTAKLVFTPIKVKGNDVVETRIITLDAGSHLNRTQIEYTNVAEKTPIVTGIVMHNPSKEHTINTEKGYISYVDPTNGANNGTLFIGHAFPNALKNTEVKYFSADEKRKRNNALGHVLSESEYAPNSTFDYYWGFAWDRAGMKNFEEWNKYLEKFSAQLRNPLEVKVKGRKIK